MELEGSQGAPAACSTALLQSGGRGVWVSPTAAPPGGAAAAGDPCWTGRKGSRWPPGSSPELQHSPPGTYNDFYQGPHLPGFPLPSGKDHSLTRS